MQPLRKRLLPVPGHIFGNGDRLDFHVFQCSIYKTSKTTANFSNPDPPALPPRRALQAPALNLFRPSPSCPHARTRSPAVRRFASGLSAPAALRLSVPVQATHGGASPGRPGVRDGATLYIMPFTQTRLRRVRLAPRPSRKAALCKHPGFGYAAALGRRYPGPFLRPTTRG